MVKVIRAHWHAKPTFGTALSDLMINARDKDLAIALSPHWKPCWSDQPVLLWHMWSCVCLWMCVHVGGDLSITML